MMMPMHGRHFHFHVQGPAVQPQTQLGIDKHFFLSKRFDFQQNFGGALCKSERMKVVLTLRCI